MNFLKLTLQDLQPYFSPVELYSPETIHLPSSLDPYAAFQLINFRRFVGAPLLCNHGEHHRRGVRSPAEQIALEKEIASAAQLSQHVAGRAFDLTCPTKTVAELAELADKFGWTGIGVYETFVHCDCRGLWGGDIARWTIT